MNLSEELKWRGFVNQTTLKDSSVLDTEKLTLFFGVDPSSDSMTVGNLASAMMVRHFINHGHKTVLLVGGATGMIGDPDGMDEERGLKPLDEIAKNKAGIAAEYARIFAGQHLDLVDNYDWFKDINYLAFLREVGKHLSMTQLLQREFVQARIGKEGKGISYAEFSYALIQGYDFLHLYRTKGVTLQLCGADQWGNSLLGVELIRKLEGAEAHVWSAPLVTNKTTGIKFGKSEAGAVWLNPSKTSVFDFYQFWLNANDSGVEDYLKIYTLLGRDEIETAIAEFKKNPAGRHAQKVLAYEVTRIVHGKEEADAAAKATDQLFTPGASEATPVLKLGAGAHDVIELLIKAGLAESKSAAQRLFDQGGVRLNQQRVTNKNVDIKTGDVLQAGKRRFVKIV